MNYSLPVSAGSFRAGAAGLSRRPLPLPARPGASSFHTSPPSWRMNTRNWRKGRLAATGSSPPMQTPEEQITITELQDEASKSYLSYAMSVLLGRAIPDARDGLKPVHRRILFAMNDLGLDPSKPFRKSARVVGEVLGKLHPHGDKAVYDALVRLAQDFSMNQQLVDGQGNFGSIDDDPAAAMRYTECRLALYASRALLDDLDKGTVDLAPNFDSSQMEPTVLPAKVPNLLVNGSQGIAVGMGTNIPPHNLSEVVAALQALIANPDITPRELMQHMPAPDFPTGGEILDVDGLENLYSTGRGAFTLRARIQKEGVEDGEQPSAPSPSGAGRRSRSAVRSRPQLVITELPYQVWKGDIVQDIDRLISEKMLEGAEHVEDQSDRERPVRVVVHLKSADPEVASRVKNALLKLTRLQISYQARMVAITNGLPKQMDLKQLLESFLEFRCTTIERRAEFDLSKYSARLETVQGLLIAQDNTKMVVELLNTAKDEAEAEAILRSTLGLTANQAQAVLGMPLRRLLKLEREKLATEGKDLEDRIASLRRLLSDNRLVLDQVAREAAEVSDRFGRTRKTGLVREETSEITVLDVIPNRPSIVMLSRTGSVKRMGATHFAAQNRGGRGKSGAKLVDGDEVGEVLHVMDHDMLLFFTKGGDMYSIRALSIPESTRTARGQALVNLLKLPRGEDITACVRLPSDGDPAATTLGDTYLAMLTRGGLIKKTPLSDFKSMGTSRGVLAFKVPPGDSLLAVRVCTERDVCVMASSRGRLLAFPLTGRALRSSRRTSGGVRSMRLKANETIVGMDVLPEAESVGVAVPWALKGDTDSEAETDGEGEVEAEAEPESEPESEYPTDSEGEGPPLDLPPPWVLLVSAKGYGKRVPITAFRVARRVGMGLKCFRLGSGDELRSLAILGKDGQHSGEDIILSSQKGVLNRIRSAEVVLGSRTRGGTRLMRMDLDDELTSVTVAPESPGSPEENGSGGEVKETA